MMVDTHGSLFTITVSSRDENADWCGVMRPQTVRASSLQEALTKALDIPFQDWVMAPDGGEGIEIQIVTDTHEE